MYTGNKHRDRAFWRTQYERGVLRKIRELERLNELDRQYFYLPKKVKTNIVITAFRMKSNSDYSLFGYSLHRKVSQLVDLLNENRMSVHIPSYGGIYMNSKIVEDSGFSSYFINWLDGTSVLDHKYTKCIEPYETYLRTNRVMSLDKAIKSRIAELDRGWWTKEYDKVVGSWYHFNHHKPDITSNELHRLINDGINEYWEDKNEEKINNSY